MTFPLMVPPWWNVWDQNLCYITLHKTKYENLGNDHRLKIVISGQITMMIPCFLWPSGAQRYSWSNYNDYTLFYDHRLHRVISGQITMMIPSFLWPSGAQSYIWSNYNDDSQFFMTIGCTELYLVKLQWWFPFFFMNIGCTELYLVKLQWWFPVFYDHRVHRVISGPITMMISCFDDHRVHRVISGPITMMISCFMNIGYKELYLVKLQWWFPVFMTIGCTELYLVQLQWWYPVLWTSGTKSYIWSNYNDDILFYDHRVHRVISGQITMMISCFMNIGNKELYLVKLQWWYPVLWTSGTKSYIWSNYNDDSQFFMTIGCTELYLVKLQWWYPVLMTIGCTELYLVKLQWWYPVLWTSGTKSYIWSNYNDDILFYEHRVQRVISGPITMMISCFEDHRVHRVISGQITMMISCFMNIGYKELYLVKLQWWYPVL